MPVCEESQLAQQIVRCYPSLLKSLVKATSFRRLRENIAENTWEGFHHILHISWARIFGAQRVVGIFGHFRQVFDFPHAISQMQKVRTAFSVGLSSRAIPLLCESAASNGECCGGLSSKRLGRAR
jgi:hypothetical protein